ncbi:redoxin domain-containing protein [Streptomyces sp. NPDC006997]|uniref:redoxin domain-containing protein n=1 Tax=Streptomyces sp. NPDC006997 TaxID=3155356 RepID=UPI0033D36E41
MRTRTLLPAVLTVASLTLVGCGGDGDSGAPASTSSPSSAKATASEGGGSAEVPEALRFTGTTVDGKPFDGASLAGRPTVLWFWAPWCPKCRAQAAETAKVAEEYAGKANVVGVAGLDGNDAMRDFVDQTGTGSFPHLSDEDGTVWKRFEVTEQSRYVILDKDGETVYEGVLPGGEGLSGKVAGLTG